MGSVPSTICLGLLCLRRIVLRARVWRGIRGEYDGDGGVGGREENVSPGTGGVKPEPASASPDEEAPSPSTQSDRALTSPSSRRVSRRPAAPRRRNAMVQTALSTSWTSDSRGGCVHPASWPCSSSGDGGAQGGEIGRIDASGTRSSATSSPAWRKVAMTTGLRAGMLPKAFSMSSYDL